MCVGWLARRCDAAFAEDDVRLPSARTYSAAMSHSSMVDPGPRFSSTGIPLRLAARSRLKFCMFLAPI